MDSVMLSVGLTVIGILASLLITWYFYRRTEQKRLVTESNVNKEKTVEEKITHCTEMIDNLTFEILNIQAEITTKIDRIGEIKSVREDLIEQQNNAIELQSNSLSSIIEGIKNETF